MEECQCVVLALVGNSMDEIEGASHLCASLLHFEPSAVHMLFVCDGEQTLQRVDAIRNMYPEKSSSIVAPPKHPADKKGKYLGQNVLFGLNYITRFFRGNFVLKVDCDSLIIGRFVEHIERFFQINSECGICGTLGRTSNRRHATYGFERQTLSPLIRFIESCPIEQWKYIFSLEPRELFLYAREDLKLADNLRACATISTPVMNAMTNGYLWLEYCQGGGYALKWDFLMSMRQNEYLENATYLYSLPTGEDVLMAMYCRSLGYSILDYSDLGHPFSCMWTGLPFHPDVLLSRGHSIIHSLKGDTFMSRKELQEYFRCKRSR